MSEEMAPQLPTPGKEHELLKPFEGTFRAVVKIYTGQDDPYESAGTMESKFALGGLYLEQAYQGDAVDGPFPAFAGKGFWGYNFQTGKYEGFWVDNVSSIMQREDGEVDESGKVWEMTSEVVHPQAGKMVKRSVIRLIDDDHHEVTAYLIPEGGPEFKNMEISYSRSPS